MKRHTHWFITMLVIVFVLAGVISLIRYVRSYEERSRLEGIALPVTATITRAERYGSEDDESFKLYVTYEINGTVCRDVYYKTESDDRLLGSQVLIEVDPADPTVIRPEDLGLFVPALFMLLTAGAGLGLVVTVAGHMTEDAMSAYWVDCYATGIVTPENVRQDVEFEDQTLRSCRLRLALALLVLTAAFCVIDGLVRGLMTGCYVFMPTALLVLLGVLMLRRRSGEIELQETQVEEILDHRDSDGDMIRRQCLTGLGETNVRMNLLVTCQGRRWDTELRKGAEFIVAKVGGRPDRFYSVQEFQMRNE